MRFSHRAALAAALALYASAANAQQASQTPTRFVVLDYMKVAPGKEAEYVRLEQQVFKPLHQQRVKNKEMVAWALYQVPFTADTRREYDYVTANVYDNIAATEAAGLMATFQRLHPGKAGTSLIAQTEAARVIVRHEIWQLMDQTTPLGTADNPAPPAKYFMVNFMLTKAGGNYETVEKELWKPIHQDLVKSGAKSSWALYGLVLPGGTSYPSDYATVDGLGSLTAITNMYPDDLFKRVHPTITVTDLGNRTAASRNLVRQELWVLVDVTR